MSTPDSKRWLIVIATMAIGVVVLMVCASQLSRVPDPPCQGRHLSSWLKEYDYYSRDHANVNKVVRDIGTNAFPLLIEMLNVRESKLEIIFQKVLKFTAAETYHRRALAAFRAFNAVEPSILPDLVKINREDNYPYVMSVMAHCGQAAATGFAQALTNKSDDIRCYAAYEFGWYEFDSRFAIDSLVTALRDSAPKIRETAAMSLARSRFSPPIAVPALLLAVKNESDAKAKTAIVFALGQYRSEAKSAVTALRSYIKDSDEALAYETTVSLREIGFLIALW